MKDPAQADLTTGQTNMPSPKYDEWGYPLPGQHGYRPRSKSESITFRSLLLPLRRYRTIILLLTTLVAGLLYLTSGTSRESIEAPVDWSRYAYVQYVTDSHNLCNAFMIFDSLHKMGSKAQRVLMYPYEWKVHDRSRDQRNTELLQRAEKLYNVKLKPVTILDRGGETFPGTLNAPSTWDASITKLRAWELDEYDRVLHLDSDMTLLKHLDELFLLPKTPIAMPRAYWINDPHTETPLTSMLMLIEPNVEEFKNFMEVLRWWKFHPDMKMAKTYDMELINHRFKDSAMVLPHRPYGLLTSEFRQRTHRQYLGTVNGPHDRMSEWNAEKALAEAKLVHFSDWPLPKPWIMWPTEGLMEIQPDCDGATEGTCVERTIWKNFYEDFRLRRRDLCGILSVPAPK